MESVCGQDRGTHECTNINSFGEASPWDLCTWKAEDIKEDKHLRKIKVRQSNMQLVYLKMSVDKMCAYDLLNTLFS